MINKSPENSVNTLYWSDILKFLIKSWKSLFVGIILGLFVGAVYFWITPNQYQSVAQTYTIKYFNPEVGDFRDLENIADILSRFSLPSSYSQTVLDICEVKDAKSGQEAISRLTPFTPLKNTNNLLQIKFIASDPALSLACVRELHLMFDRSQRDILHKLTLKNKAELVHVEAEIANLKKYLSASNNSALYLVAISEVRELESKINKLKFSIRMADNSHADLVSPIFTSKTPVYPSKKHIFIASLILGFLFAMFYELRGFLRFHI